MFDRVFEQTNIIPGLLLLAYAIVFVLGVRRDTRNWRKR